MRRLLILGVLFALILDRSHAATIHGVVVLDELNGPPLSQVIVRAPGSRDVSTDDLGRFALTLTSSYTGEWVRLEAVLPGYSVVNPTQLEVQVLADEAAAALTLVLTREPIRDEMARRFYRAACWVATRERARSELAAKRGAGDRFNPDTIARDQDLALHATGALAMQFANVPPASRSSLYRSALNRFLEGHAAESLRMLSTSRLLELPRATEIEAVPFVEACLLKARILVTQCQFQEARTACNLASSEVPGSYAAWLATGFLEHGQRRPEASLQAFQRALTLARASEHPGDIATALVATGHLHRDQGRLEEARRVWVEALALYRNPSQPAATKNTAPVAATLSDLAMLDMDQGRFPAARDGFAQSMGIYLPLEKAFPMAYGPMVAALRSNLAILFSLGGRPEEARRMFEQALGVQRLQAQDCASGACADLARTLFNLGLLEHRQKRFAPANTSYTEALSLYRDLAQEQPSTYLADLADTLNNLGMLQRDDRQLAEAAESLRGALAAYRAASRDQPDRFRNAIARVETRLQELEKAARSQEADAGTSSKR